MRKCQTSAMLALMTTDTGHEGQRTAEHPPEAPGAGPGLDEAALLRTFLAGRDAPCPQCGYNLRDLLGERCPECGEQLVLRVKLVEPKLAAPIAGLIGLAAGLGLNALLLLYAAIMITMRGRWGRGLDSFVWVNLFNGAVVGAALAAWLRKWRRIRVAGPRARWGLVAGCFALSLLDLIVFVVVMD